MKSDFKISSVSCRSLLRTLSLKRNQFLIVSSLLFISIFPTHSFSQITKPISITGYVKDEGGKFLDGATVKVKGGNKTAIANADGKYQITVPSIETVLIFSHVGYLDIEKIVGIDKNINVTLSTVASNLDEVVVIGYGTAKRKDLITSVGKANVNEMKQAPVTSYDQMLAGRVAGVNVMSSDGQPGGAATITIRGSSVSQETSPLYVIDGFPVENMDMNSINPSDIESLEILKDPSSIAIYGSRGGNGVILITTRKGKPGPPRLSYTFNENVQKISKEVAMMGPYEFVKLQLELDSIGSTTLNPVTTFHKMYLDPTQNIDLNYYKTQKGYNWQNLLIQPGYTQSHALNLTGGNSDTRYSISGGYFNQKGIIINTGLKRIDGKISLDQKLSDNLRTGVSASYANTTSYGTVPSSGNGGGVVQGMWQYRPTIGLSSQSNVSNNAIDSIALAAYLNDNSTAPSIGDNLVNPLIQAQNEYRKSISNTSLVNAYLEYSFLKNFKLRFSGGYNATSQRQDQFYNSQTQQGNLLKNASGYVSNTNGINGTIQTSLAENMSTSNTLTYNVKIKNLHKIDAVAGFEYQYARQSTTALKVINISQAAEYLGIYSLGAGGGIPASGVTPVGGGNQNQLYSGFARVNYNYASKYYLMMAMRADGSSKFAAGHQWGYFPSAAAGWSFSEEKFMEKIKSVISYGKIRVSYGNTGNNRVGDFSYLSQLGSVAGYLGYPWSNVGNGGVTPYFYGNKDLTWETTKGFDYGLTLEFLKGNILMEAIYYTKSTKNFLLGVTLPYSAAYPASTQYQNTGQVSNNGFEFSLNTVNIKTKNFLWSTNFNIGINKNKIVKFYNGLENIRTTWGLYGAANAYVAKEGGPISEFYGYQWGGVYQYNDFNKLANGTYALKNGVPTYAAGVQPGDPKYKDINGDGVVDANDQTTLGSPLPLYSGGFSNNFSYKNWSLNIFFQGSYGNKILNANRVVFENTGSYSAFSNQFASYANRWTPTNPTNDIPRARYNSKGDAGGTNPRPSSRVIEDGSFLRLKTISLGYNLPASILKKANINSIRLFVSAQNIFTWTKYSGMDPEVSTYRAANPANSPFGNSGTSTGGSGYVVIQPSSGYAALAGGYDYTPYPRAFILNFGLNVIF